MDIFTILALCYSLSSPESLELKKEYNCQEIQADYLHELKTIKFEEGDLEAIKRITYAEAMDQGGLGITAVIFVILNRQLSGKYGASIQEVINAKNQFEPATRASGWINLPKASKSHAATVETIVSLIMSGNLLDPTHGSFYFQNPVVVSKREHAGKASKGLTRFGNKKPTVKIKDHEFYVENKLTKDFNPVQIDETWDVFGNRNRNTKKVMFFH